MKQETDESLVEFGKRFKNAKDIMETRYGKIDMNNCLKNRQDYVDANEMEEKDFQMKRMSKCVPMSSSWDILQPRQMI